MLRQFYISSKCNIVYNSWSALIAKYRSAVDLMHMISLCYWALTTLRLAKEQLGVWQSGKLEQYLTLEHHTWVVAGTSLPAACH